MDDKRRATDESVRKRPKNVGNISADKATKALERHADIFADIVNTLLYHGEQIVRPENLIDGPTESIHTDEDGMLREKRRDITKYDKGSGVKFVLYGIENQTAVSEIMPVRVMGYDYLSYMSAIKMEQSCIDKHQMNKEFTRGLPKGTKIAPVITIVLYYGEDPWDGPMSLYEMMDVPEHMRPYIPDYKLNLFQISSFEDGDWKKFRTEFKALASALSPQGLAKGGNIVYNFDDIEYIRHPVDLANAFGALTKDERYFDLAEMIQERVKENEEEKPMPRTEFFDLMEERGVRKGMDEGIRKGELAGRIFERRANIRSLMNRGYSAEQAMDMLGIEPADRPSIITYFSDMVTK